MKPRSTRLKVCAPDGRESEVELKGDRLTVGRVTPAGSPDVRLDPDPQRWVGRLHCTLESHAGVWSVSDNATVNGTLLRRRGVTNHVVGRVRLQHGDTICILGDMTAEGQPLFWQLTLIDPFTTQPAPFDPPAQVAHAEPCLEYDWVEARVYRRAGETRTEISGLRPQAHKLIRYMADLSHKNGGAPVACSYHELIRALWGEPDEWPLNRAPVKEDVRDVVSDLRQRIESDPANPCVLETVRGFGYRLMMCPDAQVGVPRGFA